MACGASVDVRKGDSKKKTKKSDVLVALPRLPGKAMTDHRQKHVLEHRAMMAWVSRKPFMGDKKVSSLVFMRGILGDRIMVRRVMD